MRWCVFDMIQGNGAHVIAKKDMPFPYEEPALFARTGLKQ